jgi:phosphoserine phosphatase
MAERKIALYDIDKTSYRDYLIIDFVKYQVSTGTLREETLEKIKEEDRLNKTGQKGYEPMAQDMLIHWAKDLKNKRVLDVEKEVRDFFKTPEGNKFLPFVKMSIDWLNPTHDTYFVTAEPQFVAREVSEIHQATGFISTLFENKDGLFTGEVLSSLAKSKDKGNEVEKLMRTHIRKDSFAFGDSKGDKEMLEGVEYPICVNPNNELVEIRDKKGWKKMEPDEIIIFIANIIPKNQNR